MEISYSKSVFQWILLFHTSIYSSLHPSAHSVVLLSNFQLLVRSLVDSFIRISLGRLEAKLKSQGMATKTYLTSVHLASICSFHRPPFFFQLLVRSLVNSFTRISFSRLEAKLKLKGLTNKTYLTNFTRVKIVSFYKITPHFPYPPFPTFFIHNRFSVSRPQLFKDWMTLSSG